jgi:cytokinin riboside 5'-monophosphate phosphoribohydrolase
MSVQRGVFMVFEIMPKLLCVYCSSSAKLDAKYYALGEKLGLEMAARGWGLIYGGGNAGLMGVVARAVQAGGGYVVGVIPEFMQVRELAFTEADELILVATMRERKRIMAERATAFVTLPGGIGTLEELTEILTERYLGLSTKPLVLVNQDGYYDDLLKFFGRMVEEKFKSPGLSDLFAVAPDVDAVWAELERPERFQADALWREKSTTM